jgi:hypothetical protein
VKARVEGNVENQDGKESRKSDYGGDLRECHEMIALRTDSNWLQIDYQGSGFEGKKRVGKGVIGLSAVAFCLAILRTAKDVLNQNCATEVQVPWRR